MIVTPYSLFLLGVALVFYLTLTRTRKKSLSLSNDDTHSTTTLYYGPPRTELPGPYQLPFIGRVHDLPIQYMWLKFAEWADIYGPIYKTKILDKTFIIVSDEAIVEELLVKRAKIYSDRPEMKSLFDSKSTTGTMEYLPLMGKNKYWARQRKFTHSYLTQASNNHYYGIMTFEVKRFLFRLVTQPHAFATDLEDMASKIMCLLTWDDASFSIYYCASAWGLLTQMSPAGPISNVLTPLWHIPEPINPWKRAERRRHDEQQAFWMTRLHAVRAAMAKGEAQPSFTRQYLEGLERGAKGGLEGGDHEASSVLGMMALVGIFTVAGPLNYFLVAMACHQKWLKKCQQEIDEVCGDRLPMLTDSYRLPVLRACILETLRWKPNVPTGVAHEVEADDFYHGALIEKGTRILPLDWKFMRNPKKYPDPENYRPERYLEPTWPTYREPLTQYPTIKGLSSFGYGQRQCLGMTLTQDELLLACGALCWGFNMTKKIDSATGKEIDIDLKASNSLLIIKPNKFQMDFTPRSEARRELMLKQWQDAEAMDIKERAEFLENARKVRTG